MDEYQEIMIRFNFYGTKRQIARILRDIAKDISMGFDSGSTQAGDWSLRLCENNCYEYDDDDDCGNSLYYVD